MLRHEGRDAQADVPDHAVSAGLAARAAAAEQQKAAEERGRKAKEAASVAPAQQQGSGLQLHHMPQLTSYELQVQHLRQQLLSLGIQPDSSGPSGNLLQQYHYDHDHNFQRQQQQRRERSRSRRNSGALAPELLPERSHHHNYHHHHHQEQLAGVMIAESPSGGPQSFGNNGGEGLRPVLPDVGEGQPLRGGDLAGLGADGAPGKGTLGRCTSRGSSLAHNLSRHLAGVALRLLGFALRCGGICIYQQAFTIDAVSLLIQCGTGSQPVSVSS